MLVFKRLIFFVLIVAIQEIVAQSVLSANNQQKVYYDTLSGPLPPLIKAQSKPYLVISNIEVSPQKTVTIEPGTTFLFKNFSGLHVRGRLIARATERNPIRFTSEYDRQANPQSRRDANPFDWDGIYMTADAFGSQLSNCEIMYSVYGLLSDTKLIRLDPVSFIENGKGWITIENNDIPVTNDPFRHILDKSDPLLQNIALELTIDPLYRKRIVTRTGSLLSILGGLSLSGIYSYSWFRSEQTFKNISNGGDFKNLNRNGGSPLWNDARKKRNANIGGFGSGLLLTAAGITGLRWSFTF